MNAVTQFFFKMTGIADKLPLKGIRTYIILFALALADVVPRVIEQIETGGSLTDLEFVWKVGGMLFIAFTGALTKKAAMNTAADKAVSEAKDA